MFSHRGPQAGFTIVEVLIAVVVFSIGLVAAAGMQTRSVEQVTFSQQMSMRSAAASHWMEAFMTQPIQAEAAKGIEVADTFDNASMCAYGTNCDWLYVDEEHESKHKVRYQVIDGYPMPNVVTISLEVQPRGVGEALREKRTIDLSYVRSKRWN